MASARAPTRDEVARAAGVSPATASLALNDHPRVAARTRLRVRQVAERLGFSHSANFAARRLARVRFPSRSTRLEQVGLVYLRGADEYVDMGCLAMMREAEHELSKLHACLVFLRAEQREDWQKVQRLASTGVIDGWLPVGSVTDDVIDQLKRTGLPHVILGDHRCTQPVHCVNVDQFSVGRLAMQHLAAQGHRRIAFIGGTLRYVYQQRALEAYKTAVRELDLDGDPRLSRTTPFWSDPTPASLAAWLDDLGQPPTAISCPEPLKTEVLWRVLEAGGVKVPDDISLVGAEFSLSMSQPPAHTRIEMPFGEIARQGVLLLQRIVNESRLESSQIMLAASLVEGKTVRRLESK